MCARWCSLNFVQYCTNVYKVCLHSINVSPLGILCVRVCVCPSLAWLASSGLERMDHTDGWQRSTTAWLPLSLFLLHSFARCLVSYTSSLLSFFTSSSFPSFPPFSSVLYSLLSSFSLLPTSSPFIPDPHGRRAFGCHPLSHALPASDCNVK